MDRPAPPPPPEANVSHLADHGTVRVRIARDETPFEAMSDVERKRLIVRVLCELVAYGDVGSAQQAVAS